MFESRTTATHKSNVDLAKMIIDPKRVMRNPAILSFLTTFRQKRQKAQELNTLRDALRSDEEGPPSVPKHGTTSAPESFSQFSNHL